MVYPPRKKASCIYSKDRKEGRGKASPRSRGLGCILAAAGSRLRALGSSARNPDHTDNCCPVGTVTANANEAKRTGPLPRMSDNRGLRGLQLVPSDLRNLAVSNSGSTESDCVGPRPASYFWRTTTHFAYYSGTGFSRGITNLKYRLHAHLQLSSIAASSQRSSRRS